MNVNVHAGSSVSYKAGFSRDPLETKTAGLPVIRPQSPRRYVGSRLMRGLHWAEVSIEPIKAFFY